MGSKTGLDKSPAPAAAQATSKFQRGSPGIPWLIGLVVIPLLLAAIGYGAFDRPQPQPVTGPTGALPTLTTGSGASHHLGPSFALLSISRSGNNVTLIGEFPDAGAKAALMKALAGLRTPGLNVIDQTKIDPLVNSLDFSGADVVFNASRSIPDFNLNVESDTVILTGTAVSPEQRNAVERAAANTWLELNVENNIVVAGAPGSAPPGGESVGPCVDLQAAINAVTGGQISFGDGGLRLTPAAKQTLTQVANKLKQCPDARVTINGYTDNSDSEGINIPFSAQRAATVADFLVAQGVAGDRVSSAGLGSANPIASNDTPEGRVKNRRAEIVVS